MTKAGFLKTDWFLGVLVVIFIGLFNSLSDFIPSLERKAYDLGVVATSHAPLDEIAVIAIDDQSLANLGRWPWSRDTLAKMTDQRYQTGEEFAVALRAAFAAAGAAPAGGFRMDIRI